MTSGGGGGGGAGAGVPREGRQGLLSGQGSTAFCGPDLSVVDVPVSCRPCSNSPRRSSGMVPQIQFIDIVIDLLCAAEMCTHSANCRRPLRSRRCSSWRRFLTCLLLCIDKYRGRRSCDMQRQVPAFPGDSPRCLSFVCRQRS